MEELESVCRRRDGAAEALAVVFETAESDDGTVAWPDVSDDLTERQWGALLQTDVLLEAGDRFVIDDPVTVEEFLADHEKELASLDSEEILTDPEIESNSDAGGWSWSDKAAGIGAGTLMLGYHVTEIRDVVGPTVEMLLTPLEAVLPFYMIVLLLAAGTGVVSMVFQSRMVDYSQMQLQQTRMDEVKERLKAAKERDDEAAVERIQEEQMEIMTSQLGSFTQMLRPLAWTMLFTVPVLLWLYWLMLSPTQALTSTGMVFPILGQVAWTARIIGPIQAWLLWYSVCSLTSRQLIQKTFNIQTGPS